MENSEQKDTELERVHTLVNDTISILQDLCKKDVMYQVRDLQTELQQVKSYVLALQDRIVSLENGLDKIHNQHAQDMQTIGTQMASMQSTLDELQGALVKKKRRFWS